MTTPEMEKAARSGNLNGLEAFTTDLAKSQVSTNPPRVYKLGRDTKRAAVLRVFLERGLRGLNCFEAVPLAHDYVLRTTVSECVRYHGIAFSKRYESVPGHGGSPIECVRYTLTAEGAAKVRELLGESLERREEAVCA